jgi:uncharacterized protein
MRVILDTNIFISAMLGGNVGEIIDLWKTRSFTLIISDSILKEYLEVIQRPKFNIPQKDISAITNYLLKYAEFVVPKEKLSVIKADPSDNKFLEAGLEGKVDYIVSGDEHLLSIRLFQGIPIIIACEFVELIQSRN